MCGVASVEPVSTTMHSPAKSRTESRHRARLCSSFFTIMQRLSAGAIIGAVLSARSVLEVIEEAGFRHGGLGLYGCLIAGLLLSQIHAGRCHICVAHLAERGLILELELLRHIRGVGNLILNAAVELELLRKIVLSGLEGAESGRNRRLIVGRQRRRQILYSLENIAGIRLVILIAVVENLRGGLGHGEGYAGGILDQSRRRRRD